jgi:hypothetical protein
VGVRCFAAAWGFAATMCEVSSLASSLTSLRTRRVQQKLRRLSIWVAGCCPYPREGEATSARRQNGG